MARQSGDFNLNFSSPKEFVESLLGKGSQSRMIILGGGALFLVWVLMQTVVTIPAGHQGVKMYFGAIQETTLDEGIHFVVPIMTKVAVLSVQVQIDEIEATASSKDLQEIRSMVAVNWHLPKDGLNKLFQEIGDINRLVFTILTPAVDEVFKAIAAKYSAEEILTKRAEIKDKVDKTLSARLKKYGVIVTDVSLVDLDFSKKFNEAIESKQIAGQDAEKAKFVAEQALAQADAEVNTARGKAEAQRLINSTIDRKILLQKAIEKWDGKFPDVIGDKGIVPLINLTPGSGASR